jgi:hypothetical protein
VRDIANRGPLLFNGTKMRTLGFFNERQFWLEDDDTEFHVRAYYGHKWITGEEGRYVHYRVHRAFHHRLV